MAPKHKLPARDNKGQFTKATDPAYPAWLKEPAKAVLTALAAAGGLLTFVAAVGGAIVWVRYFSAELPASQALAALPRGELIASGAVILAAFLLVGVLAALGVYLLDSSSLNSRDTRLIGSLIGLVTVEAIVVVAVAVDADWARRLFVAELVVAIAAIAWWLVGAVRRPPRGARSAEGEGRWTVNFGWIEAIGALAVFALALVLLDMVSRTGRPLGAERDWREAVVVLGALLAAGLVIAAARWVRDDPDGDPREVPPISDDRSRRALAIGALLAVALVALPALILSQVWVAVALATALVLAASCLRVTAKAVQYKVMWCSIAVFVSVPLLGAVAGIARNIEEPQVQPLAFIRKDDGVDEAVQGIYVTETKDRLYFANVATAGCGDELEQRSGRLLWVPREDVVTMALGPPQSVEEAGTSALEMYYALTPGALAGGSSPPAAAEAGATNSAAAPTRRLEEVGPALRRDFDLEPWLVKPGAEKGETIAEAEVGEAVVLTQRPANRKQRRHTVRVGKVAAWSGYGDPLRGSRRRLEIAVPEGAVDGPVTIECGNLRTQPYLSVPRQPIARIAVVLRGGQRQVSLDASGSTDSGDGRIRSWRWWSNGGPVGKGARISHMLSRTKTVHSVSLRVVDDDGDVDWTTLRSWRTTVGIGSKATSAAGSVPRLVADDVRRRSGQMRLYVRARPFRGRTDALRTFKRDVEASLRKGAGRKVTVQLFTVPVSRACPRIEPARSRPRPTVRGFLVTGRIDVRLPPACGAEEF